MAEIRTFIAIAVDRSIITRLAALQSQLREAKASVSWSKPESIHLTLKFLGNVPEELIPAIGDALEEIAKRFSPFPLTVETTGGFPSANRPRVLWAGIAEGSDVLKTIAAEVDEAMGTLGFPREDRPFSAHLTLGRVKSRENLPQLASILEGHAGERFGEMLVTEILLFRSQLSPKGAVHTVLRRAVLDR